MSDPALFSHADWQAHAAALTLRDLCLIDGAFVPAASGKRFATVNPATGQVLAEVALGGAEDIDRAVRAARLAGPKISTGPSGPPAAPLTMGAGHARRRASARRFCCDWPP